MTAITTCPLCGDCYEEASEEAASRPDRMCHECWLVAKGVHVVRCTSCKAPMVWLRARSGSNMPVDAATVRPGDTAYDHARHRAHFATCPSANEHRRAR